jgi:hypothetical protein
MGPSGAGKSTFMDILALRKSVGELTGRILVNGARATKAFIRKTAYVPQARLGPCSGAAGRGGWGTACAGTGGCGQLHVDRVVAVAPASLTSPSMDTLSFRTLPIPQPHNHTPHTDALLHTAGGQLCAHHDHLGGHGLLRSGGPRSKNHTDPLPMAAPWMLMRRYRGRPSVL